MSPRSIPLPPRPPRPARAPLLLVFAGFDGTGGAGVLADCRAALAAGVLPLAVNTMTTAQNLNAVVGTFALPPAQVRQQFNALVGDGGGGDGDDGGGVNIAGVKIGVAGRAGRVIAQCVAGLSTAESSPPVVWDPVLAPTGGAAFATGDTMRALRAALLPRADIITPNRNELLTLAQERRVSTALRQLFKLGARRALITDIDGRGRQVKNALFCADSPALPVWEKTTQRLPQSFHGSGCLFSTTLAARLAQKKSYEAAATAAHDTVARAMRQAIAIPALGRQRLLLAQK